MRAMIDGPFIVAGPDRLPLTLESCYALRERYGAQLVVDSDLFDWAREAQRNPVTSKIQPVLAAAMANRPYQITGAEEIARRGNVVVTDEPGLGKSAQVLAALMQADVWEGRHLILCPKTAVNSTWRRQIQTWSDGQFFGMVGDKQRKARVLEEFLSADAGARFLVTNPETLRVKMGRWCAKCERWETLTPKISPYEHDGRNHKLTWKIYKADWPELFGIEFDSAVADEADRYMLGLRPQTGKLTLVGEGLTRIQAKRRIPMTGTPFRGKEHNIFGLLHWTEPRVFKGFWSGFVNEYFERIEDDFGVEIGGILEHRREAFEDLLDRWTIRRTRAEVRSDLPENLDIVHWVEMEPEHRKQYDAFREQGFVRLGDDVLQGMGVLAEITRCKQMAFGAFDYSGPTLVPKSSAKFDRLHDLLQERGLTKTGPTFGHMKYIVASQFTEALVWMESQLNANRIATLRIDGSVTGRRRDEAVDDFSSEGGPRVLLLNTMVASSITLDAWCDEMFIIDETVIEDDQVQLRGRIDNRGERIAVRVFHYLRTEGTVDETIAQDNLSQAEMQDALLDGRRGLDVAKRLIGRKT